MLNSVRTTVHALLRRSPLTNYRCNGQGARRNFRNSGPSGVTTSVLQDDWHRRQTGNQYTLHYLGHLSLLECVARQTDMTGGLHHRVRHIHQTCMRLD